MPLVKTQTDYLGGVKCTLRFNVDSKGRFSFGGEAQSNESSLQAKERG